MIAIVAAGCGSGPSPSAAAEESATAAAASASTTVTMGPPAASTRASTRGSGLTVDADPGLLAFVPGDGSGLDFTYDPETTTSVAADSGLGGELVGLAIGLYRVSGAAPDAPDFAIVNVGHLRDPAADEAWFRDWRDTYDSAACARAGGVVRHAQTEMAGRTVYIGSCAGGAFTYHARTGRGAIVVSLTSVGPARLGATIMERLEP